MRDALALGCDESAGTTAIANGDNDLVATLGEDDCFAGVDELSRFHTPLSKRNVALYQLATQKQIKGAPLAIGSSYASLLEEDVFLRGIHTGFARAFIHQADPHLLALVLDSSQSAFAATSEGVGGTVDPTTNLLASRTIPLYPVLRLLHRTERVVWQISVPTLSCKITFLISVGFINYLLIHSYPLFRTTSLFLFKFVLNSCESVGATRVKRWVGRFTFLKNCFW